MRGRQARQQHRTRGGKPYRLIRHDPQERRRRLLPSMTRPHGSMLFVKGSSMVGSGRRGRQLLRFQPTKDMVKAGFLPLDLRFWHRGEAKRRNIPFILSPRQDWINETVKDLKRMGLL